MSTVTPQSPLTEEEYVKTLTSDTVNLYEVIDGIVVEKKSMGALETALATELAFFLQLFVREHSIGLVVTEMLFTLDENRRLRRRPDTAFVSYARWPEASVPHAESWNVVPDLAVEVVSPSNTAEEIDAKIVDYFAAGVKLLWFIFPDTGRVHVYTSANESRILERSETLTGGEVLQGFELPIEKLFAGLTKPQGS